MTMFMYSTTVAMTVPSMTLKNIFDILFIKVTFLIETEGCYKNFISNKFSARHYQKGQA